MTRVGAAAVVVMAVLVVTSTPVSAATVDANASIHTTESDFKAASTLSNLSVDGTGTGAELAFRSEIVADFEDGTTTTKASDWDGFTGDTGSLSIQSSSLLEGSKYASLANTGGRKAVQTTRSSPVEDRVSLQLDMPGDNLSAPDSDFRRVRLANGSTTVLNVTFQHDGDLYVSGTDVGINWDETSTHTLEIRPYFGNGSARIILNGTKFGPFSMTSNPGAWDTVELISNDDESSSTATLNFDFIELGGGRPSGTYISSDHAADNVEQTWVNITALSNAEAVVTWEYWTGSSWQQQSQTTYTTAGNKTRSFSRQGTSKWRVNITVRRNSTYDYEVRVASEGVRFDSHAPTVNNSSAAPRNKKKLDSDSVTLKIDVNDTDFAFAQSDTLTLEWQHKGPNDNTFSTLQTTTTSSNGTKSITESFGIGGTHQWRVVVSDAYGNSQTSATFKFTVPGNLTVYNVTSPESKLDKVTVTAVFYGDDLIVSNTTTNGVIDLTGKPVNETLIVELEAANYHTRTVVIRDIYSQQRVYMLNKSSTKSVETRFELDDNTGRYDKNRTTLIIQRPLNISGSTEWEPVAGDYFGVKGVTVDLEEGQRYRVVIQNDQGDRRILGTYSAPASETVTLTVSDSNLRIQTADTYAFNASKVNGKITAAYTDPENATTDLRIVIHEYGNQSNEIYNQSFAGGPFGNVTITQPLTSKQNNTSWVVEYQATRNGSTKVGNQIVGSRRGVGMDINAFWLEVGAIGLVLVIPSVTPGERAAVGAILASLMAAIFWWIQILPAGVGVGVLTAGTFVGVIWKVRSRGGEVQ